MLKSIRLDLNSITSYRTGLGPKELIVVTILVAAEGGFKLPKITSRSELKAVLGKLGSLRKEDVLAVEVR